MNALKTRKSKNTYFDGYWFRSRLEARYAVFFRNVCPSYQYEKEGYELSNHINYLPDFYLPSLKRWFEIKGDIAELTKIEVDKMVAFNQSLDEDENFSVFFGDPFSNLKAIKYADCSDCLNLDSEIELSAVDDLYIIGLRSYYILPDDINFETFGDSLTDPLVKIIDSKNKYHYLCPSVWIPNIARYIWKDTPLENFLCSDGFFSDKDADVQIRITNGSLVVYKAAEAARRSRFEHNEHPTELEIKHIINNFFSIGCKTDEV